jgi:trehalose/maltose hydrolase-like predicted phosphorylase
LAGLGYTWPADALRSTVDFYVARMSHGSTLSRIVHAWVHARTDRSASWTYLVDALTADLHDTQGGTTREGIHLGAMAGTIDLAERCYLGLETRDDALWLNPRLPDQVTRLHTTLAYRGHRLRITATHNDTTIAASPCDAQPATVRIGDHLIQISGGQVATLDAVDRDGPQMAKTSTRTARPRRIAG